MDYPTVLRDLQARDEQDRNRAVDPLRAAEDAVVLDTTSFSFEQSLQAMMDIVNKVYGRD